MTDGEDHDAGRATPADGSIRTRDVLLVLAGAALVVLLIAVVASVLLTCGCTTPA